MKSLSLWNVEITDVSQPILFLWSTVDCEWIKVIFQLKVFFSTYRACYSKFSHSYKPVELVCIYETSATNWQSQPLLFIVVGSPAPHYRPHTHRCLRWLLWCHHLAIHSPPSVHVIHWIQMSPLKMAPSLNVLNLNAKATKILLQTHLCFLTLP